MQHETFLFLVLKSIQGYGTETSEGAVCESVANTGAQQGGAWPRKSYLEYLQP